MVRAKKGAAVRQARVRLFKMVEGYWGRRKNLVRTAKVAVLRARRFAYRDRRNRKRDLRKLWIIRINAGCRGRGFRYAELIHGLRLTGMEINRKMLAHLAVVDPTGFDAIVAIAKDAVTSHNEVCKAKEEQAQAEARAAMVE